MFKVPEFDQSDAQFRFEFTTPDGEKHSVPKVQYIPLSTMEKARESKGVGFIELMRLINPDVASSVSSLSPAQLSALEKAWITESGSTVGESSASAS